jgi:hypothetical protein
VSFGSFTLAMLEDIKDEIPKASIMTFASLAKRDLESIYDVRNRVLLA